MGRWKWKWQCKAEADQNETNIELIGKRSAGEARSVKSVKGVKGDGREGRVIAWQLGVKCEVWAALRVQRMLKKHEQWSSKDDASNTSFQINFDFA